MSNCLDYSLRKIGEEKLLLIEEIRELSTLINPTIPIGFFVEKLSKHSERITKTNVRKEESYLVLISIGSIYSLGAMINREIYLIDSQNKERKFNYLAVERMVHSVWKTNKN